MMVGNEPTDPLVTAGAPGSVGTETRMLQREIQPMPPRDGTVRPRQAREQSRRESPGQHHDNTLDQPDLPPVVRLPDVVEQARLQEIRVRAATRLQPIVHRQQVRSISGRKLSHEAPHVGGDKRPEPPVDRGEIGAIEMV